MTKYEREVYRLVNESRSHLTVEQVYEAVRENYPGVSLATIYNNLNRLCGADMIHRISVDGSPDRYDRASKHDHIVCVRCGRLIDRTASLREQLGDDFFYYDLKVYALCPDCRAAEGSAVSAK